MKRVFLFGYRGASGEAPENTIPGFQKAIDLGMDGVVFPVRASRDKKLMVMSDSGLARIAGGQKSVGDYNYQELKRLDAGAWFDDRYRGERILLLEELIELIPNKMMLIMELNGRNFLSNGLEEALIRLVKNRGIEERVVFSSYNFLVFGRILSLDPSQRLGIYLRDDFLSWVRKNWYAGLIRPCFLHPSPGLLNKKLISWTKSDGAKLVPYQMNQEGDILSALDSGVDGIISESPLVLRRVYQEWEEKHSTSNPGGVNERAGTKHTSKVL